MGFFFVLFIGIAFVIVIVSIFTAKQTDQAWEVAANKLRLNYVPGGFLKARRIEGAMRGHWVCVDTFTRSSGKHSSSYTRFEVRYREPLDLGLQITRQGFLSPLMSLLGAQDIKVGDDEFDRNVVVKGRDPDEIIDYLTPERCERVQRTITAARECVIDDEKVQRIDSSILRDPEQIAKILRQLVNLADALSSEPESPEPEPPPIPQAATEVEPVEQPAVVKLAPVLVEVVVPVAPVAEPTPVLPARKQNEELFAAYRLETPPASSSPPPLVENVMPAEALPPMVNPEAPAVQDELSIEAVCGQLFDPNLMTFQTTNLFEQRFRGRQVNWAGTLQRAGSYASDLIFGNAPGVKATFDICEIDAGLLGARIAQAVVQLPPESENRSQERTGDRIEFSGRLLSCDGFTRTIYVADGELR